MYSTDKHRNVVSSELFHAYLNGLLRGVLKDAKLKKLTSSDVMTRVEYTDDERKYRIITVMWETTEGTGRTDEIVLATSANIGFDHDPFGTIVGKEIAAAIDPSVNILKVASKFDRYKK
jgi:hypothetical protein